MKRAVVALLLAAAPVRAATIEVRVQDEQGTALPAQSVELSTEPPPVRSVVQRTGESGTATFSKLKPGTYQVSVYPTSGFVAPGTTSLDPPKRVTLTRDEDRVSVVLQVRRGVRLVARMRATRSGDLRGTLVLVGERTGATASVKLEDGQYVDRVLLPDRWQVQFLPPSGWTTVRTERNGESWQEGAIELPPDATDTFLEWEIAAPGSIEGKILSNRQPPIVGLQLERVAPGPWAQEQEARGADVPRLVTASSDVHGDWGALLPDGTWRVSPTPGASTSVTVRPPSVLVEVPAGGSARADFELTYAAAEGETPSLSVGVVDPDGNSVAADVVVFKAGTQEVVVRGAADPIALLRLEAGSYRVEASHPDYLGSSLELPDFVPAPDPRHVQLRLRRGARIRVHATGDKAMPAEGIEVTLSGGEGERERSKSTDASGWASFPGLRGGVYTLTARTDGSADARVTWEDPPQVTIEEEQEVERRLRVLPAATLVAHLGCLEGEALPLKVNVRVVPAATEVSDAEAVKAALDAPVLEREVLLQAGGALEAGPLDAGVVRVALLPAEFDRPTWAPGTESPADSGPVQIDGTGATDLGNIRIHCGPRAAIRLDAQAPPVDLRRGTVQVEGVLLDRRSPLRRLDVTREEDVLEVAGLPQGTVELTLTLCSPDAPVAKKGQEACSPAEGLQVQPVRWTVRVPAVLGRVSQTSASWPWPGKALPRQ